MPKCERAGKYAGYLKSWNVGKTAQAGLPQFEAYCELHSRWNASTRQSEPLNPPQSINAWIVLFKKDGTPNMTQVDNLKDALGWDGKSLKSLHNGDWAGREVFFTINEEPDNKGGTRLVVAFINPAGGTRETSDADLDALEAQFAGKLGGAPQPAAATNGENPPW